MRIYWTGCFPFIISFCPHSTPASSSRGNQAQRGYITCSRSHSSYVWGADGTRVCWDSQSQWTLCLVLSTELFSLSLGMRQRKSEGCGTPGTEGGRQASVLNLLVDGEHSDCKGCQRNNWVCWLRAQALEPAFLGPDLALSDSEQVI